MRILKHFRVTLCLALVVSVNGLTLAEIGVSTKEGTSIVATGPYLMSIIDDPDPIGIWMRHSQPSSTRAVLNENGGTNGDGRPSMTFDPTNGVPIVTWGKNNGSGFDIVESHFENGAWTSPAIIAAAVTLTTDPEPSIVLDRQTSDVHIVYIMDDTTPKVMHTTAPVDFSSWTSPNLVSEIGEISLRPSVVVHEGTVTVAYESHISGVGSTPRVITVAKADGLGGFTHETLTNSHGGSPNRPRLHTGIGSSLWIDWIDDTNDMAWSRWNPGTEWGSVQIEPFTDIEDRDYHARGRVKRLAAQ